MFDHWGNTRRIAIKGLILAALILIGGCGTVFIRAPTSSQGQISTPFTLQAQKNDKTCTFDPTSFSARLDQTDISGAFTRQSNSNIWSAPNYDLPVGTHTFSVKGRFTGSFCGSGWTDSDSVQLTVTDLTVSVVPVLTAPSNSTGSIALSWTYLWPATAALPSDGYELQQSTTSASSGFSTIQTFSGRTSPATTTLNRAAGSYWYRVRAQVQGVNSGWSAVRQVTVSPAAARSLRIVNNLSGGGSDKVLRLRIAATDVERSNGPGAEQLSPDSYCATLPGEDIAPGETYEHDLAGFGQDYFIHIGLGIWDPDPPSCPNGFEKKMWTTDAQFNLLYIYSNLNVVGHASGVRQCNLGYNAANNIIATCGASQIPFLVNVNNDPIGP